MSTPLTQFLRRQRAAGGSGKMGTVCGVQRMMDECLFVTIWWLISILWIRRPVSVCVSTGSAGTNTSTDIMLKRVVPKVERPCFPVQWRYDRNEYVLDVDAFRQYYAAGIVSYQVTLDGWKHDETRPHVSGKGTLQTILNNLIALSTLCPKGTISVSYDHSCHGILAGTRILAGTILAPAIWRTTAFLSVLNLKAERLGRRVCQVLGASGESRTRTSAGAHSTSWT
ncbi:MAG: hypothetical protein ACLU9S_15275 [Oscillospiraceae bacterium]